MSFFQNPFNQQFLGVWVLGDRAHNLDFECPANTGRGDSIVSAWSEGPYDMSGNDADGNSELDLHLSLAIDAIFDNWVTIIVTLAPADSSAVLASEIVTDLNANSTFSTYFEASLGKFDSGENRVLIKSSRDSTKIKFFVMNGGAESLLNFNARAGVSELPVYFARHNVAKFDTTAGLPIITDDRFVFSDGQAMLVELDPDAASGNSVVDDAIIANAADLRGNNLGFNNTTIQADWQLLGGRSGLFEFSNDQGSGVTVTYPAGAKVGDLAMKTIITGADVVQIPYVLIASDLITPP